MNDSDQARVTGTMSRLHASHGVTGTATRPLSQFQPYKFNDRPLSAGVSGMKKTSSLFSASSQDLWWQLQLDNIAAALTAATGTLTLHTTLQQAERKSQAAKT